MKIIPVIDVLDGIAVHAVRGIRKEYQPLKSRLCKSVDPVEVATSFKAFGFKDLYMADLDAITRGQPNSLMLKQIVDITGLKLMVDAGVTNLQRTAEVLDSGASKIIIGTETLTSTSFVAEAIESLGTDKVIVSLDLMGNTVLSSFELGKLADPLIFLRELEALGVSQIIVLDMRKVGSREGINLAFLRQILCTLKADMFVGGGVRDVEDLMELKDLGVSGVLVATALHSGRILRQNLKQKGLL